MRAAWLAALAAATSCHALRVQHLVPQRHATTRTATPVLLASSRLEERIQETTAANAVVIYSKSWCPFCQKTKVSIFERAIHLRLLSLSR